MVCECISYECFAQLKITGRERYRYMRKGKKPIKAGHPIPEGAKRIKGSSGIEFYRLGEA